MSDINWMEEEAYSMAEKFEESLNKAYKQGVTDAYKQGVTDTWNNVQALWNNGTFSIEWSADEMMHYAENECKHFEDVKKLADEMGINALYAMVCSMRGEQNG